MNGSLFMDRIREIDDILVKTGALDQARLVRDMAEALEACDAWFLLLQADRRFTFTPDGEAAKAMVLTAKVLR